MKLLRTHVRVNPNDSLGQGLDAVITLVVLFGAGFFADRWLGTTPWLMIAFTLVAGVGVFYKLKRGYEARMAQHDRDRRAASHATDQAAAQATRSVPGPSGEVPSP